MLKTISKHGHSFLLDDSSNPLFWQLFETNNWEKETFDVLAELLNKDSIVLDIGSWEGPFTLFSACIAKKIYAIEPDTVAHKALEANLKANAQLAEKISVYSFAFAETKGKLKLYARNSFGDSAASLLERSRDTSEGVEVETETFENFIRNSNIQKVDFIKMDIEGAEFFILPGMKKILQEIGQPCLHISFHPNYLQELLMRKKIKGIFWPKVFFRLSSILGIYLFDKKIKQYIQNCFDALAGYKFAYNAMEKPVEINTFLSSKKYRKAFTLLFSHSQLKR